MDGNSNFLLRFFVFRVFAENEGAADPTRAGVLGAALAQSLGLPLALILTRTLVAQDSARDAGSATSENKKPVHAAAQEKEKAHK
jgi:hypothetical protein